MKHAVHSPPGPVDGPGGLCTACFTGTYPIPVEAQVQGKELLEGLAPPR